MVHNLSSIEKKIRINFKDKRLLIKSLIHKSYDSQYNNEKLEFLGDRVLGLVIAKTLLQFFPNDKEGVLDKKLSLLVNKTKCYEIGKKLGLQNFIQIGNVKSKKNKIENKIISDSCEAFIGAIYLDQGIEVAEKFILKFWKNSFNFSSADQIDPKSKLQEYSLKKYKILPKYKLLSNTGPNHKPLFNISVSIKNSIIVKGKGGSKKEAEQKAAAFLLKKLGL